MARQALDAGEFLSKKESKELHLNLRALKERTFSQLSEEEKWGLVKFIAENWGLIKKESNEPVVEETV